MFWKKIPKKSINKIIYKKQKFEVGKAVVEITFDDKSKFTKFISGQVNQYVGHEKGEPDVRAVSCELALDKTKRFLHLLDGQYYGSIVGSNNIAYIVDDDNNVTKVKIGVVTEAKIVEIKDFSVEFNVAEVVSNK